MIVLPCGKFGHQHAVRIRVGAEPRLDLGDGLGVAHQRHAERGGGGLPRVVVGRRADAAEAEHDVAAGEGLAQQRGEPAAIVAFVARPGERKAARAERRDDVRQVLVGALAGEDLVADDERTDARGPPPDQATGASANLSFICVIMFENARSISGSASTRRA